MLGAACAQFGNAGCELGQTVLAADAARGNGNEHRVLAREDLCCIEATTIDIKLAHLIDDHGKLQPVHAAGLNDQVLQKRCLPRSQKPVQDRDGHRPRKIIHAVSFASAC